MDAAVTRTVALVCRNLIVECSALVSSAVTTSHQNTNSELVVAGTTESARRDSAQNAAESLDSGSLDVDDRNVPGLGTSAPSKEDCVNRRVPWEMVVIVVVAGVGFVDAIVGGQADLAVVFAAIVALSLVAVARSWTHRHRVGLRADLVAWLSRRASERGTTLDDEAERAISAFRAGVTPDPDPVALSPDALSPDAVSPDAVSPV